MVCTGPSETFTITVNPCAQVNAVDSQVLCNGDISNEVIFTTTNTDGTTTYNWTNDNTSIGLPGSGSGSIPAFGVVNTSNTSQTATITVTPTYENNGVVCIGAPESFTMTVNPDAQVDLLQSWNTVACDGDFTPVYIFTTSNIDGTAGSKFRRTLGSNFDGPEGAEAATSGPRPRIGIRFDGPEGAEATTSGPRSRIGIGFDETEDAETAASRPGPDGALLYADAGKAGWRPAGPHRRPR